jgi:hypothetical protein
VTHDAGGKKPGHLMACHLKGHSEPPLSCDSPARVLLRPDRCIRAKAGRSESARRCDEADAACSVAHMNAVLRRLHNPHGRDCGCDADCWCQRTAAGRVFRWWFPARFFGLHHKNRALEQWKLAHPEGDPAEWKRNQDSRYHD